MSDKSYSAGELILAKNDVSNAVYMIIRGKVKVVTDNQNFTLSDGDIFGEEGLLLDKPSPYTAVASEETLIQILEEEEARKHIFENPQISFTTFVKHIGRVWNTVSPVSLTDFSCIRFLEEIIPFAEQTEDGEPDMPAAVMLKNFSEKTGMDKETLIFQVKRMEPLGHVKLREGERILTAGKNKLSAVVYSYYKNVLFSGADINTGSGLYSLASLLKAENRLIFDVAE